MENFRGIVSIKQLSQSTIMLNHVVTVVFKIITYLQYLPVFVKSNDKWTVIQFGNWILYYMYCK